MFSVVVKIETRGDFETVYSNYEYYETLRQAVINFVTQCEIANECETEKFGSHSESLNSEFWKLIYLYDGEKEICSMVYQA